MRLAIVFLLLSGCIEPIAEHTSPIGHVTSDCIVAPPPGITALRAPVSLEYPGSSLWIWDELPLDGGGTVASPAARITGAGQACTAPLPLVRDADQRPASLLALTPDEQADNAARTDGTRLALAPVGGVVDGDVGYLYYEHVRRGPGAFDAVTLGTGLCVLAPGATGCARVADAAGSTLLWRPGERVLDAGGLVVDEGQGRRAVIAGCRRAASFEHLCTVASAPVASLRDPSAYQVLNVFDGWIDDQTNASVLANVPGAVTLSRYEGGYLLTSLDLLASRASVQRSAHPGSDYGHPTPIFDAIPSSTFLVSGGREHAGLRPDARSVVVSYATDGTPAGLHLVTFRFEGDFQ